MCYRKLKKSAIGTTKWAEMFKAQTDIGVSDKLQLFFRKTQFLLDNKNAWALGLYEKTPSCLRGKHGRHCSRCVRF